MIIMQDSLGAWTTTTAAAAAVAAMAICRWQTVAKLLEMRTHAPTSKYKDIVNDGASAPPLNALTEIISRILIVFLFFAFVTALTCARRATLSARSSRFFFFFFFLYLFLIAFDALSISLDAKCTFEQRLNETGK